MINLTLWIFIPFLFKTCFPQDFCSVTQLCLTLCDPMDCSSSGFFVLHHLPEFAQTHVHWVGDAIQPSHPLSFPHFLTSTVPSIRVFSNVLALQITWPKYWSFRFSINPSSEYSRFIPSNSSKYQRKDWGVSKKRLRSKKEKIEEYQGKRRNCNQARSYGLFLRQAFSHILWFSSSLKYQDSSIWCKFHELFCRCEYPPHYQM